jgi:hypothetical protein
MQSDTAVDISRFKEWVLDYVSPEDPLYKLMKTKDNQIPKDETAYLTTTIVKLIEVAQVK